MAMQLDHIDIYVQDFSLAFSGDGTSPLCEQLELLEAGVNALEDAYAIRSTVGMRTAGRSHRPEELDVTEEICEITEDVSPICIRLSSRKRQIIPRSEVVSGVQAETKPTLEAPPIYI